MEKVNRIWTDRQAYIQRYIWPLPKFKREVVVMVDGVHCHGGLTDRFRNILSVYSYCKQKSIRFRLFYEYPHRLIDILLPAEYDWRTRYSDLSFHILDSQEISLYVTGNQESDNPEHIKKLDEALGTAKRIQLHEYGSAYFAAGKYAALFRELFKPSEYLARRIENTLAQMPEPYESVTLRFQRLLGDFEEGRFEVLPEGSRQLLIQACLDKIDRLFYQGYFHTSKVLVTSDSPTFLALAQEKSFVYTIPGAMEHMDFTANSDLDVCAKSFVDLFLLMRSQKLTQLICGRMYKSGFPAFAAELGDKPYSEIVF